MRTRFRLLVGALVVGGVTAAAIGIATIRLAAQGEPLRVYDLGRVCVYAVDTGGMWGVHKDVLGVDEHDACPKQRR